jgi:hypothetical protein
MLKSCLLQASSLKRLRIQKGERLFPKESRGPGPRNFDFQEGEIFPALEELSLPSEAYNQGYELSESHCQQWLTAMDWSKLNRLELDHGSPQHLFSALTGRVVELKALSFGFWPNHTRGGTYECPDWDCPDMSVLRNFLNSIRDLRELVVANRDSWEFDQIGDWILERHGRTLRKLHVSVLAVEDKGWDLESVQTLAEYCSALQDLSIRVAMDVERTRDAWVSFCVPLCHSSFTPLYKKVLMSPLL